MDLLPASEEIRADLLREGDRLVLGFDVYPIRRIEAQGLQRAVYFAKVDAGLVREDFGRLVFAGFEPVRRALAARDVKPGESWAFREHRTADETVPPEVS